MKSVGMPGLLSAMRAKGFNDESLAHKIGKSKRAIQSWRLGDAAPKLPDLTRLLDVLGVSLNDLTGPAENN